MEVNGNKVKPQLLHSKESDHRSHCLVDSVGSRGGLDVSDKHTKFSTS
jgi:hypothetical protein